MVMSKLPAEASTRGENIYSVSCGHYNSGRGGRRHYAVCLKILGEHQSGKPNMFNSHCNRAIESDTCPAQRMRALEIESDEAMYYEKRPDNPRFYGGQEFSVTFPVFDRGFERGSQAVRRQQQFGSQSGSNDNGWGLPSKKKKKVVVRSYGADYEDDLPPKKARLPKESDCLHADLVNKLMKRDKDRK